MRTAKLGIRPLLTSLLCSLACFGAACTDDGECASFRCIDNKCDDWVWICEVAEELDLFGRHPSDF